MFLLHISGLWIHHVYFNISTFLADSQPLYAPIILTEMKREKHYGETGTTPL